MGRNSTEGSGDRQEPRDLDGERLSRALQENSSTTTAYESQQQRIAHNTRSVAVCVPRTLIGLQSHMHDNR